MGKQHGLEPWTRSKLLATVAAVAVVVYGAITVAPAAAAPPKRRVDPPPLASAPLPPTPPQPLAGDPSIPSPAPDSGIDHPDRPFSFDPARSKPLDAETTETKRAWRNPDGTQTLEVDSAPVRFRDAKGSWVDVDLGLVPAPDGTLVAKAATSTARIGTKADGDVAMIDTSAGPIRLRHLQATAAPATVAGAQATYKGALGGRDLTLALTPQGGVEESVTLPDAAAAGSYQDQLILPAGTSARQAEGGVEILDGSGAVVAQFGGAVAYDAKGAVTPVSVRLVNPAQPPSSPAPAPSTTTTVPGGGTSSTTTSPSSTTTSTTTTVAPAPAPTSPTVTVEVTVGSWLADPARVFPVVVDPTLQSFPTGGNDTFVLSGATYAGTSFSGAGELWLGANVGQVGRAYLQFGGLPAPASNYYVNQSYLSLHPVAGVNDCISGRSFNVAEVTQSWTPSSTTWNHQPTFSTTPASTTSIAPGSAGCSAGPDNQPHFDTTSLAQKWLTVPNSNNGLVLYDVNEATAAVLNRYDSSRAGIAPKLYITYGYLAPTSVPAADSPGGSVPDPATYDPATAPVITTATPRLAVQKATDEDNDTVLYLFRASPSIDAEYGAKVVDSGWTTGIACGPNNSEVCYDVPPGALLDGVTYGWHVWTYDNNTAWVQPNWTYAFRVDLRLGDKGPFPRDTEGPVGVNLVNGNAVVHVASPTFPTIGGPAGVSYTYNSQATPAASGVNGAYYLDDGTHVFNPSSLVLVRQDPSIAFWWWNNSPAPGIPATHFMVRWSGYVTVPVEGDYYWGASSDDGARVWIATDPAHPETKTQVLDRWFNQSSWPVAGYGPSTVHLTAGTKYPIQVDYYQDVDHSFMHLMVKGPLGPNQTQGEGVVPSSWLSTDPSPGVGTRPIPLPQGWTMAPTGLTYLAARIEQNAVVFTDVSGAAHTYRWYGTGYAPPPGEDGVVGTDGAGQITLVADDGVTYSFDAGGRVSSATVPADDGSPASLAYTWTTVGGVPRLSSIYDPAGGRTVTLLYGGGSPACPIGPPPGLSVAPAGMLCQVNYFDGTTSTKLWYNGNGQLARVEDPGDPSASAPYYNAPPLTDFGYDGSGRLQTVRTPLAADVLRAPSPFNRSLPNPYNPLLDSTVTLLSYDGSARVTQVALPTANASDLLVLRPAHNYEYPSTTGTLETRVRVAGGDESVHPWARQVTFSQDAGAGTTTVVDADATGQATTPANRATTTVFDAGDRVLSVTDSAGRMSTTIYDGDTAVGKPRVHPSGRVTDTYGPAPGSCFAATRRPSGSCTSPPPAHTATAYDSTYDANDTATTWTGLAATYFKNRTLSVLSGGQSQMIHGPELVPDSGGMLVGVDPPLAGLTAHGWSSRYTGEITLDGSGSYSFVLFLTGQGRLWVDDTLVVDAWSAHSTYTPVGGTFSTTTPGRHRFRIEYAAPLDVDARLGATWTPAGGSNQGLPADHLAPRYSAPVRTTTDDSNGLPAQVTVTTYDTHANGLVKVQTQDPGVAPHLALATTIGYEAPALGRFMRPTSRTLPAGDPANASTATQYSYYGPGVTRPNPCPAGGTTSQGGLLQTTTTPDPDGAGPLTARVSDVVYDADGRVVASKASTADAGWVCTTYDPGAGRPRGPIPTGAPRRIRGRRATTRW